MTGDGCFFHSQTTHLEGVLTLDLSQLQGGLEDFCLVSGNLEGEFSSIELQGATECAIFEIEQSNSLLNLVAKSTSAAVRCAP